MSIHPSLNISEKSKKQRSVLKRAERIKTMASKGSWKEGDTVFGLPKIKIVKMKIKKEKAVKAVEGAVTPAGTPAAAAAPAAGAKSAAGAKPAAGAKGGK